MSKTIGGESDEGRARVMEGKEEGATPRGGTGGGEGGGVEAREVTPVKTEVTPVKKQNGEEGKDGVGGTSSTNGIYEIGTQVSCKTTFDGQPHPAEVISRRKVGKKDEKYLYYVHYLEYNKRLDEWVEHSRLSPITSPAELKKMDSLKSPSVLSPRHTGIEAGPGQLERKVTRNLKRRYDEIHHTAPAVEDLTPAEQTLEREHEEKTKVKNIQMIELGKYELDTWYYSPFPDEYSSAFKLFFCEYCLKYMHSKKTLVKHMHKCGVRKPPGKDIYSSVRPPSLRHKNPVCFFEVDGAKDKRYCQSLCLLSKLFLDHKTCFYDVEHFWFYVLTERDSSGYHIVGYFSKEKNSAEGFNLACILTLPSYQRKGYGKLLIAFSYELSKLEGKVGTPERPLSDLGLVSYRSYWTRVLMGLLRDYKGSLSIKDLSSMTAIRVEDIVQTLQTLNLVKYYKGQHILNVTPKMVEEHLKNFKLSRDVNIDSSRITWRPHNNNSNSKKKS
ncbi:MYST family histone acetyltransferase [Chloropicon primus]|uniref:histone acetyltransferase n=1 Tax=Chloropicon primus TaxID=1764295 RepID=A0A5B8MI35_9CHLO|nr:MYST family histone acetyltransferase [Chloropicon primus]UPQ98239.1 MYST family histone acetyltransferase [Chloropicon primus]|eukprot:QDZ19030.1 MYST family histone acetyltransferase [Chloropicon primus]